MPGRRKDLGELGEPSGPGSRIGAVARWRGGAEKTVRKSKFEQETMKPGEMQE